MLDIVLEKKLLYLCGEINTLIATTGCFTLSRTHKDTNKLAHTLILCAF